MTEVIVLSFSTLMYVVEPSDTIDSLSTAMWVCTVTVTTVGYGDVTPSTTAGRVLAGVLCFLSVLFMAMPISVLGNAAWHRMGLVGFLSMHVSELSAPRCLGNSDEDTPFNALSCAGYDPCMGRSQPHPVDDPDTPKT